MPMLEMSLCHFFRIPLMASTEIAPKKIAAHQFFSEPDDEKMMTNNQENAVSLPL
jgi:hypothetical protein